MAAEIDVEIVFAMPDRQHLLPLRVPAGCTAREAVRRSGIAAIEPGVDFERAALGVFGQLLADPDTRVLDDGERVEIYRPLMQEPRAARRLRQKS